MKVALGENSLHFDRLCKILFPSQFPDPISATICSFELLLHGTNAKDAPPSLDIPGE